MIFAKDQVNSQFFIKKKKMKCNLLICLSFFCFFFFIFNVDENKKWFARLKILVRYIYDLNDQTPITFIAHSMGGKMLLIFLQQMPQTWKDKYISKVITLNTPWGGSVQSIQAMSVGYTFGSTVLAVDSMMQVQRSSPSVIWLMPSEHFWKQNEVLVMTTKKNYTLANINEFFE